MDIDDVNTHAVNSNGADRSFRYYKRKTHRIADNKPSSSASSIESSGAETTNSEAYPYQTNASAELINLVGRKKRERKAPQPSKREVSLKRFPFKYSVFANQESREVWVLIHKRENSEEIYLVAPEMQGILDEYLRPIKLQLIREQGGNTHLLYTKLTDGYSNTWMESAELCSEQLEKGWGKVQSDPSAKKYVFIPCNKGGAIPTPESFPDLEKTIKEVFADRYVADHTHPILEEMGIYLDPVVEDDLEPEFEG